jgi:PKD repeat protein
VPLTVNFNGSGSSDPDGSITAYAWDLDGDGQYDDSTAQQPSFTYTTGGTYTVRLRVTDNQSAQDVSDPITITASSGSTTYATEILADSPLAYWRLGEASGATAADASGNGRVGSYLNTPTLGASGALASDTNTAVGFNGSNEYVNVPYQAALNPAQVTVEAWAYPTGGQGTYRSIVTSRDYAPGNARGFILYASSANTWQFWLGNGDWTVVYGPPIVLNQWTHLVGTYDGTTARLYVNGVLGAFSTTTYLQNAVRPLRIASGATDKTSPQYYLPGRVDEVAVYGSALSAGRVQAHFAAAD